MDEPRQDSTAARDAPDPVPVQIVLQGGGARLAALIPVIDVLQTLQVSKKIRITRVAGTSAGSIAACMLASGLPIDYFRTILVHAGRDILRRIFLKRHPLAIRWALMRGKPILAESELRGLLHTLFSKKKIERFKDLKIRTYIISTDLRNRERRPPHGDSEEERLVDAIVSSCAIPFAFRTYRNTDLPVDGGICANLPAIEILDNEQEYGKLIAFTFANGETRLYPDDLLSYCHALLSTAMENSVRDACYLVERSGGIVCEINTRIGTFDFDKAIDQLESGYYEAMKAQCKEALEQKFLRWRAITTKSGWMVQDSQSVNDTINSLAEASAKDLEFSEHFLQKTPASEDRSIKQLLYNRQSVDYCRINKRIASAKEVDIVSLVLRVARSQELEQFILECISKGGKVRILLSDPDGKPLALRQNVENDGDNRITWEIKDTLKFLGQIVEKIHRTEFIKNFEYRVCRHVIYASITRIDNNMLVTHYLNSKRGFDSPTMIVSSQKGNGGLFKAYKEEFDCLWNGASTYSRQCVPERH